MNMMQLLPRQTALDETRPWNSARQMLVCTSVTEEAPDVRTFTFAVEHGGWFRYEPGQFITLELRTSGGDLHRTYTISSSPSRPYALAITIKAQKGSIGTRWLFDNVGPGFRIRAYGPAGNFTLTRHPARKYLFISAGSGITPVMSMLRWLADCAPESDVTFINSARRPEEIIFRAELEYLATRMPNLSLGFIPERRSGVTPWSGLTGRIDPQKLMLLAPDLLDRETFCCGPEPFMNAVGRILRSEGFSMDRFHQESFGATAAPENVLKPANDDQGADGSETATRYEITVSRAGSITGETASCKAGDTLLQAARAAGIAIPAACESGLCGTCKVLKTSGEVDMRHGGGILDHEINSGYVLACCSRPLSPVSIEI